MSENIKRKFTEFKNLISELESKSKKNIFFFASSVIIGGIVLIIYLSKGSYHTEEDKTITMVIGGAFAISAFISFRAMSKIGVVVTNLQKNLLEITSTGISGVYTENPSIADNAKYFKIPYEEIDKIEIDNTNITLEEYHNFIIYYQNGMIRLSIQSPEIAKSEIEDAIQKVTT